MPQASAGSISSTCPYALLRRQWQWHLLTMLRQTLKTEAIDQLVDTCFRTYPDGLVTNVQKGALPAQAHSVARYVAKYMCPSTVLALRSCAGRVS